MRFKRSLLIGAVALIAATGCTTGMSPSAMDTSGGDSAVGQASPATVIGDSQSCAGWYDSVAGACDSNGP